MPDWATFAAATVALTLLLLHFTRRSQRLLERARIVDSRDDGVDDGTGFEAEGGDVATPTTEGDGAARAPPDDRPVLTTRLLLANAAVSQAGGLVLLVGISWWTAVPSTAFGVGGTHPTLGLPALASLGAPGLVALGVAAGLALAAGNEAAARLGVRIGVAPSNRLRAAMAPDTPGEWVLLLGVALPIVALFEESLFRGALVGALAAGFAVEPWLLAVASSVAFGLGHGAQGRLGIALAGLLGLALAGLFVVSGSLLVPVVAHYAVNAVEFAVREGP